MSQKRKFLSLYKVKGVLIELSEVYIRAGTLRSGFSPLYHEVFDRYHPLIGDKATLYYLYLLRYRNNESTSSNYGKSWRGRKGVVEKFQLSYSTLPVLDELLCAVGLVDIELKPSHNGADKIYYVVHDPLAESDFYAREEEMTRKITALLERRPEARSLVGKELKRYLQVCRGILQTCRNATTDV